MDFSLRTATKDDLDDITNLHLTAVSLDPECPYRYPYRYEYPEDHWKFSRIEYTSYLDDPNAIVTLIEISDYQPSGQNKTIAFSVCHLPGSHGSHKTDNHGKDAISLSQSQSNASSTRRDANHARVAAFKESIAQAKKTYFVSKYGENQIYIGNLACDPEYQRRGAGGKLLRHIIEKAEAEGLPVTLCASPMGFPLYQKLGFTQVGNFRVQVEGETEYLETPCMVLERF